MKMLNLTSIFQERRLPMKKVMSRSIMILGVVLLIVGCDRYQFKSFDERFEHYSNKSIELIKKVVTDKAKQDKIEKIILAYKPKFKALSDDSKHDIKEFKSYLMKAKDKEEAKNKFKELANKRIEKFNLLIDLMFEVKAELSPEEWDKLSEEYSKMRPQRKKK